MMFERIGFIGTGTMGTTLARAVAKSGIAQEIYLSNRTQSKATELAKEIGGIATSNETIARTCNLIFLGVKPQMMGELLESISYVLRKRNDSFTLVTMAAGLSCQTIQDMVSGAYPVIRVMPNTPCSIGAGVIQYCGAGISQKEFGRFAALLAPAGVLDQVPEGLIDAATAVSGCGPAFAYLFLEAMADGAVACGLPRNKALTYAAKTLEGAAKMVSEIGTHPGTLKDAVCSPAGSTIQGVRTLEEHGFRAAVMDAVIAAYEKTQRLK